MQPLRRAASSALSRPWRAPRRGLHASAALRVVKPFLLADIGEGIREVQVIQWFVQPGARVEEFDKLCEVQSDKASVEITSRFTGVIQKLHYESDEMAIVGKPLVDIDIQGEISPEDEGVVAGDASPPATTPAPITAPTPAPTPQARTEDKQQPTRHATLATPAVRHLTKELGVDIACVTGTGKDGRVTKEDVQKFASGRSDAASAPPSTTSVPARQDSLQNLTPVQSQMFKTMTKSLAIPHFLYSDAVDMTALSSLRRRLKEKNKKKPELRISPLAFVLKAVSQAFEQFPILNGKIDLSNPEKPKLQLRGSHNFGIAVDSPQGLLVPVVKNVQDLSISQIASEISRLSAVCREGKLGNGDLTGGTFTVSNVGSIGGGVVSPVIVDGQNAIVGMGRTRAVPAFDEEGNVVRREECVFSWSADHRVVDGATVARCAEVVKTLLEAPDEMLVAMR